ncbi:Multidrug resistance protein ABC Superfamily [Phytophthora palmivora]|uniref:Multidrug resistance protein ABC Superfamily n=1 Tax=Phytophthora palmivora TaxID=4796 RepID=A0A2P4YKE8_9STRA|nr:Multidrug resistance protein ABC Superfamily [Phytophthora palmivora]
MSSSSDSDDGKAKHKSFKKVRSGTLVRWNGEDWMFYKHAMMNAFKKILLDQIERDREVKDDSKDDEKKEIMMKSTGTEMWVEHVDNYEGKTNPATTAQEVYRLQCELHKTHMCGKDDLRSYRY